MYNFLLIFCVMFYSILFIFSIVTGIIYMSGKRMLNPLELSDRILSSLDTDEKKIRFAKRMGLVTFIVGLVQGFTVLCILNVNDKVFGGKLFYFAIGFTIFSICSVFFKLRGRINLFSIIKLIFYVLILIILLFCFHNASCSIPDGYIAVFHGGVGEVTYSTYIYKVDNGQANYGFRYINTTNTTKSWGNDEYNVKVTKRGYFDWTDDAFLVAFDNLAYSYVTVANSDVVYSIEEFQNLFLMN